MRIFRFLLAFSLILTTLSQVVKAAPGSFIASKPSLQANDLYLFKSYEANKENFVTIIANFGQASTAEFADSFLDPNAKYEIKIDTDGNGVENQTYRFEFNRELKDEVLKTVFDRELAVPFLSSGNIQNDENNTLVTKNYQIELIRKKPSYQTRKNGSGVINSGEKLRRAEETLEQRQIFPMPENYIGANSFTDYDTYSKTFIHNLDLRFKKCAETARVFVGQRKASRKENLTGLRDNLDFDFTQSENGSTSVNEDQSVFSIALELPISCLELPKTNPTIGVWTSVHYPTRSIVKGKGKFGNTNINTVRDFTPVSRLGHPYVNELLIGYTDQIKFTQKEAKKDENLFIDYFSYPVLAELIEEVNGTSFTAPNSFPREDMIDFFLEGIDGLNEFAENKKAKKQRIFESLKLNTSTAALDAASQDRLGFIAGDSAGYPNGRRPGDDVTDIFFRVLMGNLIDDVTIAPDKDTSFSDGVLIDATEFEDSFPYLVSP